MTWHLRIGAAAMVGIVACGAFGTQGKDDESSSSSSSSSGGFVVGGPEAGAPDAASTGPSGDPDAAPDSGSCAVMCTPGALACDDFERSPPADANWSVLGDSSSQRFRLEPGGCGNGLHAEVDAPTLVLPVGMRMLTRKVSLTGRAGLVIDFDLTLLAALNNADFGSASAVSIVALSTNAFAPNAQHLAIGASANGFGFIESNGGISPPLTTAVVKPPSVNEKTHFTWHLTFGTAGGVTVDVNGVQSTPVKDAQGIHTVPAETNLSIGVANNPQSPAAKVRIDNLRVTAK